MNDDWTPQFAEEAADAAGIALGQTHWRVIAESRELIARQGRAPSLAEVSARCGVTLAELRQLFPGGVEEVLARLAGVPELERRQAS
jgi:sulfur relay (sulfurtransferase) DsrC/TusE family protein